MEKADKKKQNMMQLVKRVHGLVERPELEKQRQAQDQMGLLLGTGKDVSYKEVDIAGVKGEWISVNRVHGRRHVILHCHGGGYATGSCLYARPLTYKLATMTSMDVLCFDYRLAPEHPYPAATEDAMKVWDYLMLLGYGAEDVILTGDSAGGNLALSLTLTLKEEGRKLPGGIVLLSPWTDMTCSGESHREKAEVDPILDRTYMNDIIQMYACGRNLKNPLLSPLFGDFAGFPPVYIQVGENEILLSDSVSLRRALQDANVPVKLEIYPGMWHVFQLSPMKAAKEAIDKVTEFIFEVCR